MSLFNKIFNIFISLFNKFFNIFKKTTKETPKEDKKVEKIDPSVDGQKKVKSDKINYKDAYKVLIRPISTEKSTDLTPFNQYVFEIAKNSNKIEVKKAIQAVYNIKPVKVNIIKVKGKNVRHGKSQGKTKDWKKAIITLKQGDKIEAFDH
ncbi:50S ribosomal protein L23 [Candidatus Kuenenbacteria bacterium]|nr:50S ribosomal protein L23 [Candidatus Kuenenbacteria bacterium]